MAATAPAVKPLDRACIIAHQSGICALLPARLLKEVDQPVSAGAGRLYWHCWARAWSNSMVSKLTLTTGIPARATTM